MRRRRFLKAFVAFVLVPAGSMPGHGRVLQAVEQLAATDPLGAVISSIDGTDRQIPALRARDGLKAGEVRVVDVGRRLDERERDALAAAVDRNAKALADLRVALDNRPVIKDRLAEHDVRLEDVVGVDVDTPGSVIVYVRR